MTSAEVDAYLASLTHQLKPAVVRLREAIMASDEGFSEHLKWKAPSFVHGGEDRVTFALHPANRIRVILHRGVLRRDDVEHFRFDDPTGLAVWAAPDRGVVTFSSIEAAEAAEPALLELIGRWVRA
ncbi:protein of unknown function (DU1801) [Plantibacter sp. VKM Ac-1784]|uniref:YdhG-like domain-containing protein n=1 Tax=Plantibacter elymi (nom. nud.) TaxID=199708 RepID=A0ABY1RHY8_9MICO|nr:MULTISPECIES: DUF1801 domain-containing protein [Plantibacter]CAH0185521.1 hypothetical protein SRABI02_01590 [Plantibacter cousiniae]SMQ72658.1 protein of unknown function (DU1801) [Plantibacter sp. VKM Ac-1784]